LASASRTTAAASAASTPSLDGEHRERILAHLDQQVSHQASLWLGRPWGQKQRYEVSALTLGDFEQDSTGGTRSFSALVQVPGRREPLAVSGRLDLDPARSPYPDKVRIAGGLSGLFAVPARPGVARSSGLFDVFVGLVGASPRQ
jgi:hypothetical protein